MRTARTCEGFVLICPIHAPQYHRHTPGEGVLTGKLPIADVSRELSTAEL